MTDSCSDSATIINEVPCDTTPTPATTPAPKQLTPRERFESSTVTLDYVSDYSWQKDRPGDRFNHYLNLLTKCLARDSSTNKFIARRRSDKGITYRLMSKKDLREYLSVIIFQDEKQRNVEASSILREATFDSSLAKYSAVKLVSSDPNVFQTWTGLPTGEYHQEYIDELEKYLQNIVEDKARNIFLDTLAWLVQHNWKKQNLSFIFIGRAGSEGKTTLAKIIQTLVPANSNTELDFSQITGRFNSHMRDLLYGNIGEITSDTTNSNHGTITRLKQLTNDEQVYESKGENIDATTDSANFTFLTACSNNYNCLGIFNDEAIRRRWVPVEFQMVYTDFGTLYKIINAKDFGATLAHWLQQRDIAGFNPFKHPPEMAVMPKIEQVSRSPIFDFVEELTQDHFKVAGGKYAGRFVISSADFATLYTNFCNREGIQKKLDPKGYVSILTNAGYIEAGRFSVKGEGQCRGYVWLKELPKGEKVDLDQ